MTIAILGGGILGTLTALELADRGIPVTIFERNAALLREASMHNEGKLHLGFVYAADRTFRTADRMLVGAAQFMDVISRWIPSETLRVLPSRPFDYLVHRDTMVSVVDIEHHFERVCAVMREHEATSNRRFPTDPCRPPSRRLSERELQGRYDTSTVRAAFETSEIAVDPWEIATALRKAAHAHPRIELRLSSPVERAKPRANGSFDVMLACNERVGPFDAVLNALWANRPAIDFRMGVTNNNTWFTRRKLGVNVIAHAVPESITSVTIALGPFGDVVAYQSGRTYMSWYPDCMIGTCTNTDETDWDSVTAGVDTATVARRTLEALTGICPALRELGDIASAEVVVNGGSIFALGDSDIVDPESRLHERLDHGALGSDRYLSVDTAKYTLGPATAIATADRLAAMIAPARTA